MYKTANYKTTNGEQPTFVVYISIKFNFINPAQIVKLH